ncbi:MAG: LysR family transcriptional regulator, partial [Bacteroidota bacterium]
MNYTLHQLRIFSKIVETKSITQAARELHLSQPAVSIQLKKLQDQFEIPLTELIGRQLYITPFGQEIASAGQRILEEVHAIKDRTLAYKGLLAGKLRLSVVSTAKYVTPYFLSDFLKQHPGIDIQITVTNKSQVLRDLEYNEVDFTMMSVLPTRIAYEKMELLPNKLYLIGGRSLPFPVADFKP